ncbi:antirestriction protein ArdA [Paenibacillus flagellatus]|uniref:Antirestriction protein ArdA n=1 Tax=Paenibacillus flagellatus TaxID=2211139 RepID=A0A2V5JXQ4_9BACL|nr:antirestriction protein ArdA [Paenibacillus flagellatus]
MVEIKVYISNLAKYNDGELVGDWITLPTDSEILESFIEKILGEDDEYAIHDYEAFFSIYEFDNPYKLNELLQQLKSYDSRLIQSLFYNLSSLEDVLRVLGSGEYSCYYDMESMQDVGL